MDKAPEVMSEDELVRALDQADADLAHIETRRLRLIAALDKTGYAERVGARDTVQYIEYRYRLDHYRARRDVQLAHALPRYSAVSAALAGDECSKVVLRPAQAEAIVLELEKAPSTVPVEDLDVAEAELVRLARHLAPADLRKATIQARDILDTDGLEPEEHKAAARESLTLSAVDRGVKFKGYLANENAELLRTLITTGARPHKTIDGAPDPRPREKRQADALTAALTLAATALDAGVPSPTIPRPTTRPAPPDTTAPGTGTSGTAMPATAMPATAASGAGASGTAASETAAPGTAGSGGGAAGSGTGAGAAATDATGAAPTTSPAPDGDSAPLDRDGTATSSSTRQGAAAGRGVVPGFGAKANITVTIDFEDLKAATADGVGQTVYSNGLSAAAVRRLACDANIIPIVLGSNSEPLDVGRCERLVTKAIRRALNTRDRGCVVCGAPPVMCEAHHLIHWVDGGTTAVSNLVLLCRSDHTDLHNGHWQITITNDVVHVTRPIWADPPPRPGLLPEIASPLSWPRPEVSDVGRSPTGDAPFDDAPRYRAAARRSVTNPRKAGHDEEALRAATYLAIWGEHLPPDNPSAEDLKLTSTNPWDQAATAV
ncbi:DUF222 domain-containing protein [Kribbella sp. NPDC059898]|uniref:HNH endonuclease signature motif containing protein n=1 Tax=Kribbella sp. NPDC059898 TaxID=3346995 RepID=UPI003667B785